MFLAFLFEERYIKGLKKKPFFPFPVRCVFLMVPKMPSKVEMQARLLLMNL